MLTDVCRIIRKSLNENIFIFRYVCRYVPVRADQEEGQQFIRAKRGRDKDKVCPLPYKYLSYIHTLHGRILA